MLEFRALLRPLLTLAVLGVCVWSMRPYLMALDLAELRAAIVNVPASRIAVAAAATIGSFGALAVLEFTLFAGFGQPVPWRRVLAAAFIADTISSSVGLVLVSGGLIRLRLYGRWGVQAADVMRVTLGIAPVVIASGMLGGGIAIAAGFADVQQALGLRIELLASVAILLAVPAAALFIPAPGHSWRWKLVEVVMPSRRLRVALLATGLCDWVFAAAAAFALSGLPLTALLMFLLQFIFGWLFGTASGLPAGVGVIDATTLAAFGAESNLGSLAAGLLLFRLVYLVAPTVVAVALWGAMEWIPKREER